MPHWLANAPAWVGPLGFGCACIVLWLVIAHGVTALARWLSHRSKRPFQWVSTWGLGRLASAIGAAAALDVALLYGVFSALDVGLRAPDWAVTLEWLPATVGIMALWLAFLWGAAWWGRPSRPPRARLWGWSNAWDLPAYLAFHEASLAFLRGALGPALGSYWGAWSAVILKGSLAILAPGGVASLREPDHRPWVLLTAALDWLSSAAMVTSGSLWAGLIVRFVGLASALVAYRLAGRAAHQKKTGCLPSSERQPE